MAFIKSWETAGIGMDAHRCWQIGLAQHLHCPVRSVFALADFPDVANFSDTVGFPSLWAASLSIPLTLGPIVLARAGLAVVLPAEEFFDSLLQGHPCFLELSASKCTCRAKTALVTNVELTPQQLSAIDSSGFGAHCLQGVTKNLGLPILGTHQLNAKGSFEAADTPKTFVHRCAISN